MHRTVKICVLILALMLMTPCAWADDIPASVQAAFPTGAVVENVQKAGEMRMLSLSIAETGESLLLAYEGESVLFLETQTPAVYDENAAPVERSRAEELICAAYPDCRILFAEDAESGKRLAVAGDDFCGTIVVADEQICARSLQMGEIYRDGKLTMEGAIKVLGLHRPEADFRALELDEDDGVLFYEGEALVNGVEYEFELEVSTGKLLEWERD